MRQLMTIIFTVLVVVWTAPANTLETESSKSAQKIGRAACGISSSYIQELSPVLPSGQCSRIIRIAAGNVCKQGCKGRKSVCKSTCSQDKACIDKCIAKMKSCFARCGWQNFVSWVYMWHTLSLIRCLVATLWRVPSVLVPITKLIYSHSDPQPWSVKCPLRVIRFWYIYDITDTSSQNGDTPYIRGGLYFFSRAE